MLSAYKERLRFFIDNLYTSCKAIGVGIFNDKGEILAECGEIDISVFSKNILEIQHKAKEVFSILSTSDDDLEISYIRSKNRTVVFTNIGYGFTLFIILPLSTDYVLIKNYLERINSELFVLFSEISDKIK